MTSSDAKRLAQIALSAASKDDVTPVICGALLTVVDGVLRTTSTDRYRVHTALIDILDKPADHEFIMPRSALMWLSKNATAFGSFQSRNHIVTVTTNLTALNITVRESDQPEAESVSWNGHTTKGNFPPVITLIDTARAAESGKTEARLNLEFMSQIKVLGHLRDLPTIKFTPTGNPDKPGPVYIAFHSSGKTYAEALLQPGIPLN